MKVGWCSSRCLALLLLALLEAVTLVFPQQQRCDDLANTCNTEAMNNVSVVATGMEISRQMCSIIVPMETGDVIEWYFTRDITGNAIPIDIDGSSKYSVGGELSQILIVNNISLSDEGYYFCQLRRNVDELIPQEGTCLRVLAPAMFQTCSGYNIPQKGCSGTEMLNVTIGESVDFNIVLVHGNESERCNDQFIQMISLFKNDGPSRITLTDCPNSACSHNVSLMNRLNVWRTQNEFDIIVTLKKLTAADNGSYSAVADIRRPPNSTRVCMYKNFTLNVLENPSTNAPTTSGDTSSISSPPESSPLSMSVLIIIIVVIVVLVLLLMVLGVVVAGLLCWTCKNRHKEKKGEKGGEMYETIKDVQKFKREKKKKKKSNGVSLTDQEDAYQRRSVVEEEKMNLPEVWNSDGQQLRRIFKGDPASHIYDVPTEVHDTQLISNDREVTIAHPNHETRMLMQENSAYGTNIAIAPEIAAKRNVAYGHTSRPRTDDTTSTTTYSEIFPCPITVNLPGTTVETLL